LSSTSGAAAADTVPTKPRGPQGGFFVYGSGQSLELFDIPLLMGGVGVNAAVMPKDYPQLRIEGGFEGLLGKTSAGLEARQIAMQFGPDISVSVFHFAPMLRFGYFWLNRVSATSASLGDPTFGGSLRAGPELEIYGKNRLALDLLVHTELLGAPMFGYGLGLRYGYF
jgi:hypothetical protein